MEIELQERWNELWQRTGAKDSPFPQLLTLYNEPQRHYHSLNHIKSCLDEFDPVRHLSDNPAAILTG